MTDLRLRYEGGGTFRTFSRLDHETAERSFQPGEALQASLKRRRSVRQNDYFHALVEAAWMNQRGGPILPSWRHLKSWLLIQAGHCAVTEFEAKAMTPAVATALRKTFDTVDFSTDGIKIYMKVAKSVSFSKTNSKEMKQVVDRVVEIICTEIVPGMDPATIISVAKGSAAECKSSSRAA